MPLNSSKVSFLNIAPTSAVNMSGKQYCTVNEDRFKRRANSQRPINDPEPDQNESQQLFHTICAGSSQQYSLSGPQNVNWFVFEETVLDLFKNDGKLVEGKLNKIHEIVRLLLESDFGIFVHDKYKSQILPKAMTILKNKLDVSDFVRSVESVWNIFFAKILYTLECMLYQIQLKNNMSIRKATIVAFRDHILINSPLEEKIKEQLKTEGSISETIVHMILIVQSVFECFPPSRNKLEIERIAAAAVSPYLGYHGLYLDYNNQSPVVQSNEPANNQLHHQNKDSAMPPLSRMSIGSKLQYLNHHLTVGVDNQRKVFQVEHGAGYGRKVSLQIQTEPTIPKKRQSNLNHLMARIYK